MQVLVVSQYYPPESALFPADIAKELSNNGHDVQVLTGYPNYPKGKIFQGYRQKWRQYEMIDGVKVLRVPLFIDHSSNFLRRAINYLTFGLSASTARRFSRKTDVVYVYATQMTAALGPWLWRITGGAPYILHIQDLWPDSILGSSISGGSRRSRIIEKILNPWIQQVYKRASGVIAIAPTMVATLINRGVEPEKIKLIYNWPADGASSPLVHEDRFERKLTRIVYAGNIGDMQDLETAICAAAKAADCGVHLSLIGDGVAKKDLVKLVSEIEATNITFRDRVSRSQMKQFYAEADFGLVTLRDLPVFKGTVPSKFQAILAHGLPVVTSVGGDVTALTEQNRVGFTARAESVDSLEATFREAAGYPELERIEMAKRARKMAMRLFSKDASISSIEKLLLDSSEKNKKFEH